jgi:type I restriction enzyme, S subunit
MTSLDEIVAEIRNGIDLEQSDRPSSPDMLPISRIETISEGVIDFSRVKYATPTARDRQKYQLQSGDILFSHINSPEHIGKTALFRSNKPLIHGINLLLLRVNHEACHPEYLNFYLKSFAVRARFRTRCKKAVNQASLNQDDILSLDVPIRTLPEQKRIAAILEKADRLRGMRRYARQLSDTFLQSVFLKMFGDPRRNPNSWELEQLTELCSAKQWPTISENEMRQTGYPVFGANGQIGFYSEYNHDTPTVLVTCRGATCGTINLSPPKVYVTGNAMALDEPDEDKLTIEYLFWVLRMRGLGDAITGSAQPQITRRSLEPIVFPVPPLPLQQKFAAIVRRFERLRAQQREAERQAEHLFQTLLHRAFAFV